MKKILIEFAHPAYHKSRINRKLVSAVKKLEWVTFNDLYENYPDFFIDVKREQQLLSDHDIIIFHHPFYWYSAPALMKEWMDLVLEHGWAYGEYGHHLENKYLLSVVTTGGRREVYSRKGKNQYSINEFLLSYKQSAHLCRMEYLPPFVIHGAHTMGDAEIEKFSEKYINVLSILREGSEDLDKMEYFNDLIDKNV